MPQRPLDITGEIDRLYTLPLGEFTAARDDLLTRARALGAREAAEHVRRLRRPTLAAWMLNRVARDRPALVENLLAAGSHLRAQHADLVAGRPADLPAADRDLLSAIGALVDAAHEAAPDAAGGVALDDRLRSTLRTCALDDAAGAALRAGRIERDLTPVLPGPAPAPSGAGTGARPAPAPAAPEPDPAMLERLAAVRAELDAAVSAVRAAESAEAEAGRAARSAEDARREAEAAAAAARTTAEEARRRADEAEAAAEEAARSLAARVAAEETAGEEARAAGAALASARDRLDAARAEAERLLG